METPPELHYYGLIRLVHSGQPICHGEKLPSGAMKCVDNLAYPYSANRTKTRTRGEARLSSTVSGGEVVTVTTTTTKQ